MQNLKNDCIYHAIEKIEEIQEELFNFPCTSNYLTYYWADLHHYLFNEDYFLIGTFKAKQWLKDDYVSAATTVQDYEQFNFGDISTRFDNPKQLQICSVIFSERKYYQSLKSLIV